MPNEAIVGVAPKWALFAPVKIRKPLRVPFSRYVHSNLERLTLEALSFHTSSYHNVPKRAGVDFSACSNRPPTTPLPPGADAVLDDDEISASSLGAHARLSIACDRK